MSAAPSSRVLFYRRLVNPDAGSNGGNLKLRDCYNHVASSKKWTPEIYFDPATVWFDTPGNHWSDLRETALKRWEIGAGDVLFFSGHDWQSLPEKLRKQSPVPVINIVQPRHTRKKDLRRAFLRYPAIRIAKSEQGAEILHRHGVNGPLFVIPDTIDLKALPALPAQKDIDILVLGLKQPEFAKKLFARLTEWNIESGTALNIEVQLPPRLPTRADFLRLLARAKTVACVPLEAARGAEGFYLPALEAMAMETLVVCPHAVGNVEHCLHEVNCLVPAFTVEGIFQAVKTMYGLPAAQKSKFIVAGLATAQQHRIENERRAVLELIDQAHELWQQADLFLPSASEKKSWFTRLSNLFGTTK